MNIEQGIETLLIDVVASDRSQYEYFEVKYIMKIIIITFYNAKFNMLVSSIHLLCKIMNLNSFSRRHFK